MTIGPVEHRRDGETIGGVGWGLVVFRHAELLAPESVFNERRTAATAIITTIGAVGKTAFASPYSNVRITRHGCPSAAWPGHRSMLPAPIVVPSPMVTPGKITTLPPIHTLLPMDTGCAEVRKGRVAGKAFAGLQRVARRVDLHVGADQRVIADGDGIAVEEHRIDVDKTVFTDADMLPVVAPERRFDQLASPGHRTVRRAGGFLVRLMRIQRPGLLVNATARWYIAISSSSRLLYSGRLTASLFPSSHKAPVRHAGEARYTALASGSPTLKSATLICRPAEKL